MTASFWSLGEAVLSLAYCFFVSMVGIDHSLQENVDFLLLKVYIMLYNIKVQTDFAYSQWEDMVECVIVLRASPISAVGYRRLAWSGSPWPVTFLSSSPTLYPVTLHPEP